MRVSFKTSAGKVNIDVFFKDENLWLTQKKMSELFEVDRSVITKHIKNIFEEGELDKNSTSAKIAQVQTEGSREVERFLEYYNLIFFQLHYPKTTDTKVVWQPFMQATAGII